MDQSQYNFNLSCEADQSQESAVYLYISISQHAFMLDLQTTCNVTECPPASVLKYFCRVWGDNIEDKLTGTVKQGQSSCDWHTEVTIKICQARQAEASLDGTLDVMLKTVPNGNHLLLGQLQHLECNLVNDWIRLAHPQDLHVTKQSFNITGLRSCRNVMMARHVVLPCSQSFLGHGFLQDLSIAQLSESHL